MRGDLDFTDLGSRRPILGEDRVGGNIGEGVYEVQLYSILYTPHNLYYFLLKKLTNITDSKYSYNLEGATPTIICKTDRHTNSFDYFSLQD